MVYRTVIISRRHCADIAVLCSNKEKGVATRKACTVGCIGCMKCVKVCPSEAVKVENNLARIDPEKCTACGECVKNCPVGAIRDL